MQKVFHSEKFLNEERDVAVAYYRLPKELKEFIDKLPEVLAIDIDGWNIGFAVDLKEMQEKEAMSKVTKKKSVKYLVPENNNGKDS